MANKSKDGYTVLIKQKKLPLSLLADPEKGRARRVHLLGNAPFQETFSAGRRQKKPKLATDDLSALAARATASGEAYAEGIDAGVSADRDLVVASDGALDAALRRTCGARARFLPPATRDCLEPGAARESGRTSRVGPFPRHASRK